MRRYLLYTAVIILWTAPAVACFTPILPGINRTGIANVRVITGPGVANMVAGGASSIANGFGQWNNAPCQQTQPQVWVKPFPVFSTSAVPGSGTGFIQITRETRLSSEFFDPLGDPLDDTCARLTQSPTSDNATMRLFTHTRNNQGQIFACNWGSAARVALVVAHELGHYLGLNHSLCDNSIMEIWDMNYNLTAMMATPVAAGHAVRDYECEKADEVSISPTEDDYEDEQCLLNPNCNPYAPCWADPYCTCPILLDLDHNRIQLTSLADPVEFDIDADGELETITWTSAGTLDAFLCWDRNGNGKIDDGTELFGNSTVLADGTISPFGYIALSELDAPFSGGNSNGLIDPTDEIFSQLCVWTDLDHDGQTDPFELQGLQQAGILEIGVDWTTKPGKDKAGNLFLYHGSAKVRLRGEERQIKTTDVFFVEANPQEPVQ